MSPTALVADDDTATRANVVRLLEMMNLTVVGCAEDGLGVAPLVAEHRPDLLILDITMPRRTGLDVLDDLQDSPHRPHVIMFSMHADEAYVDAAFQRGADAYVFKGGDVMELGEAIRTVLTGERYVGTGLPSPPFSPARLSTLKQVSAR